MPSTVHALVTGGDPLEATRAAGTLVLPRTRSSAVLLVAGGVAHAGLTLGWSAVLMRLLPRRRPVLAGALAGVGIAALDLGLAWRCWPRIAALPLGPQVADHIAFGALVGLGTSARRR